jgi:hypothetical protein
MLSNSLRGSSQERAAIHATWLVSLNQGYQHSRDFGRDGRYFLNLNQTEIKNGNQSGADSGAGYPWL